MAKFYCFLIALLLFIATQSPAAKELESFTVTTPGSDAKIPQIVIQWDPATGTGFNWDEIKRLTTDDKTPENVMRVSVEYLVEGIRRMTGKSLPVTSSNDLSRGIILTTLKGAPVELQNDPEVLRALQNTGEDAYNASEAFFIRSEKDRLVIIANRWDGLSAGIAELLEEAGYEILGMGQNWIYVPDYHNKPLTFTIKRAGRPSYYIRVMGGGSYNGTIRTSPPDPTDETVVASLMRLKVGWKLWGASMPPYIGHALDSYHDEVIERMKSKGITEGFLVSQTIIDLDERRPAASGENAGVLWINSDKDGPGAGRVFISNGTKWVEQGKGGIGASLDLSVPMVREVIFEAMKRYATAFFAAHPDDIFVFGTEPEDGGTWGMADKFARHPNWYPDYLAAEKIPFGRPYALHGFQGLNHPVETWDPAAASDHVFAFNNWLLHEYDKWIDGLPEKERITTTGKDKKTLVRTSLFSYNYHDVPPNFNLDPRIRVMVAGYPKHRGAGQWVQFSTYRDIAAAFKMLLPREPSGEYRIISIADYGDSTMAGIPAAWSASPAALIENYKKTYDSGTRALIMETDYNYGKYGLGYYLINKLLWNINLTQNQLEAIRDRWFKRAFGSAWHQMKMYYDFMLPENYPSNSPGTWARAIRMIDEADKKIDRKKEPDVQKRLDDLKQFWYFYYLLDTGKTKPENPEFREFVWKCQMSYITSVDMVIDFFPDANRDPNKAAGEYAKGPAHYTHEETQAWWAKVMEHWPAINLDLFADALLANGTKGKDVDLNDLVAVKEFQTPEPDMPVGVERNVTSFFTVAQKAGDEIGFHLFWPYVPASRTGAERSIGYGLDFWNARTKKWELIVDRDKTRSLSNLVKRTDGLQFQSVDVQLKAPREGVYRFTIDGGGSDSRLAGLNYDVSTGTYKPFYPAAYSFTKTPCYGIGRGRIYFYIPKGTRNLDLEVSVSDRIEKTLVLYAGLPSTGMKESRRIKISGVGVHRIRLQPGEDGALAHFEPVSGDILYFPYLHSVPGFWARSPGALLVPRMIAKADGLTILP